VTKTKLAPSILSADFARLGDQVRRAEEGGADYIHVDVMDGRFVPNLTVGPLVVDAVRSTTSLPLDVHLMIEEPERYARDFIAAGASILTVHQEACRHLQATLALIRSLGARAGVSLCPATPVDMLDEITEDVDLILIMTVNPGFGGQKLIPATVGKVHRARKLMQETSCAAELEVDGGVNLETAARLVAAGADVLVAGSAVFGDGAIEANLQKLREVAAPARSPAIRDSEPRG
jgi:ribulose-phosphate 3-epimerase